MEVLINGLRIDSVSSVATLDKADFARLVGATVPKINMWIKRQGLPVKKIGSKIHIFLPDYLNWLDSKTVRDRKSELQRLKLAKRGS